MEPIEIILLALGAILVIATYVLSEKFEKGNTFIDEEMKESTKKVTEELVREEVSREIAENIDQKIEELAIQLDKMTTEKIMAVGNYSDDVLEKIEKNHDEVMFLYNMLNDKESALKDMIRDVEALKLSIKKMTVVSDIAASGANTKNKTETKDKSKANPTGKSVDAGSPTRDHVAISKSNKNEEILKMYKSGKSNMDIAKALGIGIGEVRLVIDLFKDQA